MKKMTFVMLVVLATALSAKAFEPEQLLISNVAGTASDSTHGTFDNLINGSGLVNWTHNASISAEGMSTGQGNFI